MYDREWLQRRAAQSAPLEACGFILAGGETLEVRNVAPNPYKAFEMDKRQAIEKLCSRTIIGLWHTHPSGIAHPSGPDIQAITQGRVNPEWLYIIATATQVTEWNPNNYAPVEDSFWEAFCA